MADYVKHEFKSGEKLYAFQLNQMDEQIAQNEEMAETLAKGQTEIGQKVDQLTEEVKELKSGTTQEIVLVNQVGKVAGNFLSGDALGGGALSWYATSGSVVIENNEAVFKSGSQWGGIRPDRAYVAPFNLKAGHIIYTWAMIKTTSNKTSLDFNGVHYAYASGNGEYEFVSGYFENEKDRTQPLQITDNNAAYGSEIRVKKVGYIDLTACYGDLSVPTKEQIDKMLADNDYWFDTLTVEVGSGGVIGGGNAVQYTEQSLTAAQKRQARKNIDLEPEWEEYGLPVLSLEGSVSAMTKDNAVTLDYVFGELSGTCSMKWQGSSSLTWAKKNYTINFDQAFEAADGWGAQKKYCLKANYIDHSHARNVVNAILWGQIVKSRDAVPTEFAGLVNGGAIDGFPVIVLLNGDFHGLYTFNIPKDGWMMGMGSGTNEAILCADGYVDATRFKEPATLDGDFDLEYTTDENNAGWVTTSVNTLINSCINSDGSDLDTTISQYLDWQSAIDYYIFCVLIEGVDMVNRNYLLATFDGTKWYFSAYDMDCTYGLQWDGAKFLPADNPPNVYSMAMEHRVFELVKNYKKDELKERYAELRDTVMSESNIATTFANFCGQIPKAIYLKDAQTWPMIPNTAVNNISQIRDYYRLRVALADKWFENLQ